MPRYRSSIEVPVPVGDAFAFVTDFRNAARWDPRVVRSELLTDGPIGLGSRFHLVSFGLGKEVALPYEVTTFEPGERAVFEGRTLLFRYRDRIDFEPIDPTADGTAGTRVTYDARLSLRGPLALGNPLLALVFRRIGDDALAGIRRGLLGLTLGGEPSAGLDAPTPEEVRRIVAMDDRPVLRNLQITLGYHRLSNALARLYGPENANWCTYAAWASKTAGTFIRGDEVRGELRRLLESKDRIWRHLHTLHRALHGADPDLKPEPGDDLGPILGVVDEVGRFIREGNRIVFAELGGLFAELLVELETHPGPDEEPDWKRFERFLERLRPGLPEPDAVEPTGGDGPVVSRPRGGQDLLRDSMRAHYAARFETDPKKRAELLLLGNALGGLHEQTRLQSCIAGALDAPVAEILYSRMNDALVERLGRKLLGPAQEVLHRLITPVGEEVAELVRELSTRFLMRLPIPGEVLELGEDHPAPPGGPLYPPVLATIEHAELAATLGRYGAEPTRAAGLPFKARLRTRVVGMLARRGLHRAVVPWSAAVDWTELGDRMRYIFVYFRSRQAQASLLGAPFDRTQVEAILAGRVPEGPL